MYEDDRTRALEMYDDIFEEAGNETAVLQLLVSPTRQAVNLARAYDARNRKYQGDAEQEPAYLLVIEELRRQAESIVPPTPKFDDGQISLFHDPEAEENVFESMGFDVLHEDTDQASEQQEITHYPDEDKTVEPAPVAQPPVIVPEQAEEEPVRSLDDFSDAVDAFLADFAIKDELSETGEQPREPQPIADIKDEDTEAPVVQRPAEKQETFTWTAPAQNEAPLDARPIAAPPARRESRGAVDELPDMTGTTERKAIIPLLILFIVLAIPVGLVCVAAILALAVLFLALAASALAVGFSGIVAAFSFSVFADILLVFGLSLALAAIGLLLLWLFIWLLAGAIPDVVRGICALARKLCYKEVSV